MKPNIHPQKNLVKFIMPDGTYIETSSTYSKAKDFHCERSINDHPAWKKTTVTNVNTKSEHVSKFMNKFSGFENMFSNNKKNKKDNSENADEA